jgi:hypothetical protein
MGESGEQHTATQNECRPGPQSATLPLACATRISLYLRRRFPDLAFLLLFYMHSFVEPTLSNSRLAQSRLADAMSDEFLHKIRSRIYAIADIMALPALPLQRKQRRAIKNSIHKQIPGRP